MKTSRRARRMQRHHGRLSRKGGLNLVSLMDVFTILVFFLLVNTSDTQSLPDPDELTLPESAAEKPAAETTVVMLTRNEILVNGKSVIANNTALAGDESTIPQLRQALLRAKPERTTESADDANTPPGRGKLTIMADKGLPYRLIRKVMLTSTASEFGRVSLAVLQDGQR